MILRNAALPFILALAAVASAQTPMAIAQGLADAEAKATIKGELSWYEKNLAPEYTETDADGKKRTKAPAVAIIAQNIKRFKASKVIAKVTKATMKGDRLTTRTKVSIAGSMDTGDGTMHAITFRVTADATWIKSGGKWLKLTEKTSDAKGTLDGKPI